MILKPWTLQEDYKILFPSQSVISKLNDNLPIFSFNSSTKTVLPGVGSVLNFPKYFFWAGMGWVVRQWQRHLLLYSLWSFFFLLKISDSNRLRKIYFQKRKGTESLLRDVEDGINCWPRETDIRNWLKQTSRPYCFIINGSTYFLSIILLNFCSCWLLKENNRNKECLLPWPGNRDESRNLITLCNRILLGKETNYMVKAMFSPKDWQAL